MKIDWKSKFGSRKFLLALLSVIIGLVTMFTNDDALVQVIAQIGGILIPIIVYIAIEGKIDIQKLLQAGIEITKVLENKDIEEVLVEEVEEEVKPEITE